MSTLPSLYHRRPQSPINNFPQILAIPCQKNLHRQISWMTVWKVRIALFKCETLLTIASNPFQMRLYLNLSILRRMSTEVHLILTMQATSCRKMMTITMLIISRNTIKSMTLFPTNIWMPSFRP